MLLEKVYQPDIMAYQDGVLTPLFIIEVVEDPRLEQEAEQRLKQFMASQICYHGALVIDGRMRVIDIFPNSARDYDVNVVADLNLSEELKLFGQYCHQQWNSEKNFFAWLRVYAQSETAKSLRLEDQETLSREVLPWVKGLTLEFSSLRDAVIGIAF